jgi:hypothetical protein
MQAQSNRNLLLTQKIPTHIHAMTQKASIFANIPNDIVIEDLNGRVGSVQERYGKFHLINLGMTIDMDSLNMINKHFTKKRKVKVRKSRGANVFKLLFHDCRSLTRSFIVHWTLRISISLTQ